MKRTPASRRVLALLLMLAVVATLLTACGKPRGMTEENYQSCKMIVSVYDAYLDYKIDNKEAGSKLRAIMRSMEADDSILGSYLAENATSEAVVIETCDDMTYALDRRNDTAKGIGMPTR